jgi:acyl carrier protein
MFIGERTICPRIDNFNQQIIMRHRLTQRPACLGRDMRTQSDFEQEVAQLIVESLNLEDIGASDIDPEDALFGEGLGLDSIDALELALAISQKYSVQLKADDANVQEVFGSLESLSAYIAENAS